MAHMSQDHFLNQMQKVSTMQHAIHEFMNKDPDIVPEEDPLVILDIKSNACMDNNYTYTKHTRHISGRVNFVRNGENYKMHNIDWCE